MIEVVINTCPGGFRLSKEAYACMDLEWDGYGFLDRDGSREEWTIQAIRTDPVLISCIKKLKEKANGESAKLKIVEVPDDVEWYIENDHGIEIIHETHRVFC